jgi:hypothetical protein
MHENHDLLNEVTHASATNIGKSYTADEDSVVKDTSLHPFEIALQLGRTYDGIKYRRGVLGVTVRAPYARRSDDTARWIIQFPNAMAALREHFVKLGGPVPEDLWDWNEDAA